MWLGLASALIVLYAAGLFSPGQKKEGQWHDSVKVTFVDSNNVIIKQYIVYRK